MPIIIMCKSTPTITVLIIKQNWSLLFYTGDIYIYMFQYTKQIGSFIRAKNGIAKFTGPEKVLDK